MTMPRPEYPRPQFERARWQNLNGYWQFDFDDANQGLAERWYTDAPLKKMINVPFTFQAPASGIGDNHFHEVVWYERRFEVPAEWAGQRVLLHFGAVDYQATVWVNGIFAVQHQGGHTPFQVEISAFLREGENRLIVRAEDSPTDLHQPRGKQYWKEDSASIFYTRTTGIWQTVWLEPVGQTYLANVRLTPDVDNSSVLVEYEIGGAFAEGVTVEAAVSFGGAAVISKTLHLENARASHSLEIANAHLWSPESPALYAVRFTVKQAGAVVDEVASYFGMRKISIQDGKVCLNNQPYVLKMVLDQGYHPQGVLTFPTDADFIKDIELTKALGFNGARKHQKVEDPRYLYWADKLGLAVWGEMANCYDYSPTAVQRITAEWQEAVVRDYSHPCIIAWTPLNESWGVPLVHGDARQINHLIALYQLTKSLDSSRLVISNDGWEHAQTDLLTIHDYESQGDVLRARYASLESTLAARPAKRDLYVPGFAHQGQPILLTEYGGVAYRKSSQEGWGYSTAQDEADFVERYRIIMEAVYASPVLQGFCYTQLTDVEQEINGLLTYDRQPKTDLATIKRINDER